MTVRVLPLTGRDLAKGLPALARLRKVAAAGEMRNATDWSAQPGAVALAQHANVVDLT